MPKSLVLDSIIEAICEKDPGIFPESAGKELGRLLENNVR